MQFVSPRGSRMLLAIAELTANPLADNEDGGREGFNAVVTDPRDFADTYFPAFRSCAQRAGASGVMCSAYPASLGSIHLQLTSCACVCATRLQCRQRNGQLREFLAAFDQAAGRLEFRRIRDWRLPRCRRRLLQERQRRNIVGYSSCYDGGRDRH